MVWGRTSGCLSQPAIWFQLALCTLAGRHELARELDARGIAPGDSDRAPEVTQEDFEQAWRELSSRDDGRRAIGFGPAGEDSSS